MRVAIISTIVSGLFVISSCGINGQDPYHYFTRLQQFRINIMTEYGNYASQKKEAPGPSGAARLKKEMTALLLRTKDSVTNCVFSKDDFGLKKAILHEFSYSLKLLTEDSTFWARSRDTTLSIEDRVNVLDSLAAVMDRNTAEINKQIRKSQLAFARFYRISVTAD